MKRKLIIFVLAVAMKLPVMGQFTNSPSADKVVPSAKFQSTSVLQQSGSTYSSQPMLSTDGSAQYNETSYLSADAPSGPRRVIPVVPQGPPTPVGDALLPLLMMAVGYAVLLYRKRGAHAPTPDNL